LIPNLEIGKKKKMVPNKNYFAECIVYYLLWAISQVASRSSMYRSILYILFYSFSLHGSASGIQAGPNHRLVFTAVCTKSVDFLTKKPGDCSKLFI
jgi:hypothetical protein